MALVPCRECQREVSTEASACPRCGCPVKPADSRRQRASVQPDEPYSRGDKSRRGDEPRKRRIVYRLAVSAVVVLCLLGGFVAVMTYLDKTVSKEGWEREEARKSAARDQTRAQIERQARIDAVDFMKQRQSKDRVFSDFAVKELVVTYLGDQLGRFGPGDYYGYKADMVVSIRSNIGVVSNVTTHRLKLRYHLDGKFMPNYSEVTDVGNVDLDSPLLKR